jgi:hypothetical protein
MKQHDDFGRAKRGAVVPVPKGKTRITIRIETTFWIGFAIR